MQEIPGLSISFSMLLLLFHGLDSIHRRYMSNLQTSPSQLSRDCLHSFCKGSSRRQTFFRQHNTCTSQIYCTKNSRHVCEEECIGGKYHYLRPSNYHACDFSTSLTSFFAVSSANASSLISLSSLMTSISVPFSASSIAAKRVSSASLS